MFTQFIETVPDAMVIVDLTGTICFVNCAAEEMFGYPRAELVGRTLDLLMPQSTRAQHAGHLKAFMAEPRRRTMGKDQPLSARRKDGSEFPAGISLSPLEVEGKKYAAAAIRDVTEHHLAATQARDQIAQLRALMALARAAAWDLDFDTGVRSFSPEMVELLGLPRSSFTPEEFFALVHPDDTALARARASAAKNGAELEPATIRIKHGDGTWRWLEYHVFSQRTAAGAGPRAHGLALDVTARRSAEGQLREAEAQQRTVLEAMPIVVAILDSAGTFLYLNRTLYLPKDEVLNRSALDLVGPEMRPVFQRGLDQALAGTPNQFETTTVIRGNQVQFSNTLRLLSPGSTQLLMVSTDITALRKTEDEVADFRAAMENAIEGFAKLDLESRFVSANPAYARMLGYEPAELVGVDADTTFDSRDRGPLVEARARLTATGRAELETMGVRKDGSLFHKHVTMIRAKNSAGQSIGNYCFMRDTSEQHRVREQLLLSDRMASVGILAAGVAHEINNPLAAVISNLHVAKRDLADLDAGLTAELREELTDAIEAADRVREIVRDLKVFSRHEELTTQPVDVQQVMESSLRMARNEIRHRAQLVTHFQPVPLVEANEARLGQVFLNLVVNAAQAIPEGDANANEIRITTSVDASGRVAIDVKDTGPGIPDEVRQKLFVPFFTTKPAGSGTGLGLSICYRIITGFKGEIQVDSALGKGSTFRVLLPAATEAAPAVVPPVTPAAGVRRGKVLVVDDEVLLGVVIKRTLTRAHDISVVTSAADALALLAGGERFDVILCDLMMPQMTGMECHAELVKRIPEQAERVVFLTGGAFTSHAREFLSRATNPVLEKPFEPSTLLALVNALIR